MRLLIRKDNRQFRDGIRDISRRDYWQDPTFLTQFVGRTYIREGRFGCWWVRVVGTQMRMRLEWPVAQHTNPEGER